MATKLRAVDVNLAAGHVCVDAADLDQVTYRGVDLGVRGVVVEGE
jgi:hypothetical protein